MLGVYIDTKDFKKVLREMQSDYKHPNESIKEFLFADEFGIIEDMRVKKNQLKLLFNQFIHPLLANYESLSNKYTKIMDKEQDSNLIPDGELPTHLSHLQYLGEPVSVFKSSQVQDTPETEVEGSFIVVKNYE